MNNTSSHQNAGGDRLRGCVDRVFFAGPTFSAGRMRTSSGEFVPFSGKFYAQEGSQVVMKGRVTTHPKYGEQFQVSTIEHDLDGEPPPPAFDAEGLVTYLTNTPNIRGIGSDSRLASRPRPAA